jgi:hypothetical protein
MGYEIFRQKAIGESVPNLPFYFVRQTGNDPIFCFDLLGVDHAKAALRLGQDVSLEIDSGGIPDHDRSLFCLQGTEGAI